MNRFAKEWHLLSYAAGFGGLDEGSSEAPKEFYDYFQKTSGHAHQMQWHPILKEAQSIIFQNVTDRLVSFSKLHAKQMMALAKDRLPFTIIGGDHTSAIGTWQAVSHYVKPLGLIWIDAHMDSHTPTTTETGRLHGMPLACLLGEGDHRLSQLFSREPALKPEHVCLLGVRSYESGEAQLLKRLGVRVFYMDEIKHRGLMACLPEVFSIVAKGTQGFGISLDLDALDPIDAPGVDVAEPGGIRSAALIEFLKAVSLHPLWYGSEIVEFNPNKDLNHDTRKIMRIILELFHDSHSNR